MTVPEIIELLKMGGGWGAAAVFYYLRKQEREERLRYRDYYENTMTKLSLLPDALKELTHAVKENGR